MKMDQAGKMKVANLGFGIVCLGAAVLCGVGLQVTAMRFVYGREEYHSMIPFIVGLAIGICAMWPISRFLSGWKKHIVRSVVFTLCVAPLPFGPEGTLVPVGLSLLFAIVALPSILMLVVTFPQGLLLTFIGAMCGSLAWNSFLPVVTAKEDTQPAKESPSQLPEMAVPRPRTVTIALLILYLGIIASLAIFAVSIVSSVRSQPDVVAEFGLTLFLRTGIVVLIHMGALWFVTYMTGKGHNWARIAVVAICVCSIGQLVSRLLSPMPGNLGERLFGVISSISQATAIVLLFLKVSSEWFRKIKKEQ